MPSSAIFSSFLTKRSQNTGPPAGNPLSSGRQWRDFEHFESIATVPEACLSLRSRRVSERNCLKSGAAKCSKSPCLSEERGFPADGPSSSAFLIQSSKIKQRQLIGFRQILQDSQISQQIDHRLADLGAVPEIILGKEFTVLHRIHHRVCGFAAKTVDGT